MESFLLANSEGGVGMQTAVDGLRAGRCALDTIEMGIRVVEMDPSVRTVGFGGAPNLLGQMECDASIMCGMTLRTGAVAALKEYLHPISVARQVMERTPHVMLVGEGAAMFAAEIGERKENLLSDQAKADYERWIREHVPPELIPQWPNVPLLKVLQMSNETKTEGDTTCFLARANDGNWAGGVSTSGLAYKHPGRLGDSPIIGAGLYVDNRYGAAGCTGIGEMTIRAGTARALVAYMKKGASVQEACREALDDLRSLQCGYMGPVMVHAIDTKGNPCVVGIGVEKAPSYWFWQQGMDKAEHRTGTANN